MLLTDIWHGLMVSQDDDGGMYNENLAASNDCSANACGKH